MILKFILNEIKKEERKNTMFSIHCKFMFLLNCSLEISQNTFLYIYYNYYEVLKIICFLQIICTQNPCKRTNVQRLSLETTGNI